MSKREAAAVVGLAGHAAGAEPDHDCHVWQQSLRFWWSKRAVKGRVQHPDIRHDAGQLEQWVGHTGRGQPRRRCHTGRLYPCGGKEQLHMSEIPPGLGHLDKTESATATAPLRPPRSCGEARY